MRRFLVFAVATGALAMSMAAPSPGATAVLYDAGLGSLPSSQGWAYLTDPLFVARATQGIVDGSVRLDTTPVTGEKAGWFSNLPAPFGKHPRQPPLSADAGFLISFTARLVAETHGGPNRAGFSVIAIADDLSAIELGFWIGEVWAQSGPDFLHAEGAAFDTTARRVRYDLDVRAGRYRLSADGQVLVDGSLRHYESFGTPYNLPEFLFFGDDTTSAAGTVELVSVSAGPLPKVSVSRAGGELTFAVETETGRAVIFEASSNLVLWEELGTAVSANGVARLTTEIAGAARFVRTALR